MASTSVDSISTVSAGPAVVSASIGADGTVDTSTSKVTGGDTSSTTTTSTAGSSSMGKDDFLKLLVTQLQYQDPLSPMDNSQMIAQEAQFESLETNNNILTAINSLNDSYKATVAAQNSSAQTMSNASSVSLIGKQVRLKETNVDWGMVPGQTVPINVSLGNNDSATVQILDSDGSVVKTLQTSGKDATNSSVVQWDGTTDSNGFAQAGTYKVNVVGSDTDSSLYSFIQSTVDGVSFASDGVYLKVAGQQIPASNIMDVTPIEDSSGGFADAAGSSAIGLLGKTVKCRQTTVNYGAVDGENDEFKVNGPINGSVSVAITDSTGAAIAAYKVPTDSTGVATIDWNGQKYDGTFAAKGTYNIVIDGQENDPSLYAYTQGQVDGLSNLSGMVQLRVGGQNISLSNVVDISTTSGT